MTFTVDLDVIGGPGRLVAWATLSIDSTVPPPEARRCNILDIARSGLTGCVQVVLPECLSEAFMEAIVPTEDRF